VCCVPRAATTAFAEYRPAGAALRHSPRGDHTSAPGTPSRAERSGGVVMGAPGT
jgi:hypothetical protein